MKLSTYLIQEAVAAEDWKAAACTLAEHFNLAMPSEFQLDTVMRDRYFAHAVHVVLHHDYLFCTWDTERGFRSYDTQLSTGKIYADIYLRSE